MGGKTACIFPAFITEFTGKEMEFLGTNSINVNDYLSRVTKAVGIKFPEFSFDEKDFQNELNSQLLAYSLSCTFFDILSQKGIKPDYVAGYSMGIYASLYATASIDFETGANLIYKAFKLVKELTATGLYGMGAIIGLSNIDIIRLIKKSSLGVEIINTNNEHSIVVAGFKKEIEILLEKAKEEGALTVAELTVNTPYHSKHLKRFSEPFRKEINDIEFRLPEVPIISTYNQRLVETMDEAKKELIYNLTEKISWHKTMDKLIGLGVKEMIECGAGKDLKKISRFIHGEYKLKSIYKI